LLLEKLLLYFDKEAENTGIVTVFGQRPSSSPKQHESPGFFHI
jgi:hypothetical protein